MLLCSGSLPTTLSPEEADRIATEHFAPEQRIVGEAYRLVAGSHAVFVSQPAVVANLIVQAAKEAIAHAG